MSFLSNFKRILWIVLINLVENTTNKTYFWKILFFYFHSYEIVKMNPWTGDNNRLIYRCYLSILGHFWLRVEKGYKEINPIIRIEIISFIDDNFISEKSRASWDSITSSNIPTCSCIAVVIAVIKWFEDSFSCHIESSKILSSV